MTCVNNSTAKRTVVEQMARHKGCLLHVLSEYLRSVVSIRNELAGKLGISDRNNHFSIFTNFINMFIILLNKNWWKTKDLYYKPIFGHVHFFFPQSLVTYLSKQIYTTIPHIGNCSRVHTFKKLLLRLARNLITNCTGV